MNLRPLLLIALSLCMSAFAPVARGQQPAGIKFLADTLIVQADGRYEADPDLATLSFDIPRRTRTSKRLTTTLRNRFTRFWRSRRRTGIAQSDISSGVLTIRPFYEGDRKKRARSFLVQGQLTLKVRDFAKLEPILENSVDDGIADFRSLTYSLSDEEAAKQKAIAEAVQHSWDRANAALKPRGQKAGALRFVNIDVNNFTGVSEIDLQELSAISAVAAEPAKMAPPPPPTPFQQPKKITVSATVECAYQIL